tara:strand:- start:4995 stop:6653 length:1659 start_codon:yes stop_codon:yes gene_type:complete
MAISLKNFLLIAEETGVNPDGSNFDQRSLGYGDNKPLITKDLPSVESQTNGALGLVGEITDNFVRGGVIALGNAVIDDVTRLGKVLIKPNGLAWAGAQLALARTNPLGPILPQEEGGEGLLQQLAGGPRNRQTLPLSVLATAGTGAVGIRFRKDGLIDTKIENGFNYNSTRGGPKYESGILEIAKNNTENSSEFTLYGKYTNIYGGGFEGREDLILRYPGGPHSTFGIGDTEIKRYKSNPFNDIGENGGYLPLFNQDLFQLRQAPLTPSSKHKDYRSIAPISGQFPIEDSKTRINLYKLGDPGVDLSDDDVDVYDVRTIDKISAASIFQRKDLEDFSGTFKDYIKFKIAVVDNENPLNDNVILFRALLDSINDNYSGEWISHKYNGRAENFYTYSGFDRKISFGFKIHTQTRHEQKPLWKKLNYLVAQTAPEYKNRRMRGVFSRLTIGDWMNEIPGFFTSVSLSWSTAYPWEIRHDSEGTDRDLNEYPHILDVSCDFQPVHNFAPSNSPTTPFILPEIGVNNSRKYARQGDDENQDQFNSNGVSINATTAEI